MWSRGACCVVAMLAVSCVQGMVPVLYDEPTEDQEDGYQLDNTFMEEEMYPSPDLMDTDSQFLYKLLAAPDYEKLFKFPYRSRRIHSDMDQQNTNLYFSKRSDVQMNDKRSRKTPVALKVPKRPQQKWKIKKGAHMVCYFKLCTFRPYV